MLKKHVPVLSLITLLLFSSCDQITKAYKETFDTTKKGDRGGITWNRKTRGVNLFADAQKLEAIQSELLALPEFAGKEVKVFGPVYFTDHRIYLMLQDASVPENVDLYDYWADKGE